MLAVLALLVLIAWPSSHYTEPLLLLLATASSPSASHASSSLLPHLSTSPPPWPVMRLLYSLASPDVSGTIIIQREAAWLRTELPGCDVLKGWLVVLG